MYWLSNKLIHAYYQKRITSGRHDNWVDMITLEFLKENDVVASLGCGDGILERHIISIKNTIKIYGADLSEEKIALAHNEISDKNETSSKFSENALIFNNIIYEAIDFDLFLRSGTKFDAIIFNMSLHHSNDPFTTLMLARNALNENGILILNEYAGLSRLQLSSSMKTLCQSIYDSSFRSQYSHDEQQKLYWPSITDVHKADQTEAPATEVIIPAVFELFEPIMYEEISSGFLHHYCDHVLDLTDSEANILCGIDSGLVDSKLIPPEFIFGVYRRKL